MSLILWLLFFLSIGACVALSTFALHFKRQVVFLAKYTDELETYVSYLVNKIDYVAKCKVNDILMPIEESPDT